VGRKQIVSRDETYPNDEQEHNSTEEEVGVPVSDEPVEMPDEQADALASDQEVEGSLSAQLERAEARAEEYLDSLQRERASFQNYKKRVERDRIEQGRVIAGNLLLKILPVLDDFYRATDSVPDAERDDWYQGVLLIQRKLERLLADEGVTEIPALGEIFDPNFHEAVGVDDTAGAPSGTITTVLQRGYKLGDRVLRPALVRVAA
jgi:molecular chaperone GrpE